MHHWKPKHSTAHFNKQFVNQFVLYITFCNLDFDQDDGMKMTMIIIIMCVCVCMCVIDCLKQASVGLYVHVVLLDDNTVIMMLLTKYTMTNVSQYNVIPHACVHHNVFILRVMYCPVSTTL